MANSTAARQTGAADHRPRLRRRVGPHRSPRPTAPGSTSLPARTHDSTLSPSRRGNAWRNAAIVEPPCSNARSGQRNPGSSSAADHQIDSAAPRVGIDEQSIARGFGKSSREQRRACTAAAGHHGDDRTPAPVVADGDSAASDSAATSSASSAGSVMTCWAPTAIAASHSPACGSPRLSRMTRPRRGSAGPCSGGRRRRREARPMPRSRLAGSAAAKRARRPHLQRRRRGRRRRASPIRRPSRGRRWLRSSAHSAGANRRDASAVRGSVDEPPLWMNGCRTRQPKTRFRNYGGVPHLSGQRKGLEKRDDPRQGGRRRRSSCISPGGSG